MTAQELNFSNFFETTADGNIGASDTSITLSAAPTSDGTSAIPGPFYLVIDPDSLTKREVVLVSSISGVIADVTGGRDVEGRHATDPSHADGTTIRMAVVGEMFKDVNDRVSTIINSDGTAVNTTLFLDEDTMTSDSATKGATQQSVKAYADTKLPLAGGTLTGAVDAGDQELTKFVAKDYKEDVATTADSGTSFATNILTLDVQDGNIFDITLDDNITTWTINNMGSGTTISVILRQDATGSRTAPTQINSTTIKTVDGGGIELSTAASAIDVVTVFYDGTDYLVFSQVNMS